MKTSARRKSGTLFVMQRILLPFVTAGTLAAISPGLQAQEKANVPAALPIGKLAYVTSAGFGSSGDVYVMTGDVRIATLAYKTRCPELLQDGKRILYAANDARGSGLFLYDLTQHSNEPLLPNAGSADSPTLSPDGTRIAYVQTEEKSSHIMTAKLDGSDVRQLTEGQHFDWNPQWSPDGKQLMFETERNDTPATSGNGGHRDVYVMDPDGKNPTNLTTNSYGHSPSWSPDGKHIAYMNQGAIFVMNSDGTDRRNVSHGKVRDSEPAWSPDGEWIAFTRTPKDSRAMDIWIMKSDGGQQRQITTNQGNTCSYSPSWSKE
jgi:tol-pal system beta propeller repeat protein TolB